MKTSTKKPKNRFTGLYRIGGLVGLLSLSGCVPSVQTDQEISASRFSPGYPFFPKHKASEQASAAENHQTIEIPSAGKRLRIPIVVERALRENIETKVFRAREREADTEIDIERSVFDPELSADLYTATDDLSYGGHSYEVNKRFETGTQFRIEGGAQSYDNYPIGERFSDSGNSDLGFRLRQPLLRGAGLKFNQSGIERAELVAVASDIKTQAQVYRVLREVESSYWAASTYQELVLVRMNSVSRNQQLLLDVEDREELGLATKIDVLEAEASLAAAKLELVSARKLYRDEVDRLQVLLGMDLSYGHMDWEFDPVTKSFDHKKTPSVKEVYENAIDNAPEIALLINDVEQREIEVFRAKQETLPRLDLDVESIRRGGGGDLSDPWETIGLVRVSMPWGNRERKALYEKAEARLEASKLTQEDEELKLKQSIFEVTRQIASGKEELATARQALKVNETKWREQLARSKEGLISTRELRESEAELRETEVGESTARLKLILAWSLLSQLDGSISERLGVELASK